MTEMRQRQADSPHTARASSTAAATTASHGSQPSHASPATATKANTWATNTAGRLSPGAAVCPLSNLKLCVFPRLADHNLLQLLEAGLAVTVNSDDPAYFGGYVNDNFTQLFAAVPALTARHAYQLAWNSFEASFAAEADKRAWHHRLKECFEQFTEND